jgi:hypothetical protein
VLQLALGAYCRDPLAHAPLLGVIEQALASVGDAQLAAGTVGDVAAAAFNSAMVGWVLTRERETSACMRRHQAFALAPVVIIENTHSTDVESTNLVSASIGEFTLKVLHAGSSDRGSRGSLLNDPPARVLARDRFMAS